MDKQLAAPLLLEPVGRATKLSAADTFAHLQRFTTTLVPSPAKTQLERLADALGVEIGAIEPSEGERREAERAAERAAARAERRAKREAEAAEEAAAAEKELEGAIEGEEEAPFEDAAEEEGLGVGGFAGDDAMEDRGDVEYGDVPSDDDDEPDNEDDKMEDEEE